MKYLFFLLMAPALIQADTYSNGLERIDALKAKTKSLLGLAGFRDSSEPGQDEESGAKPSFLRLHNFPNTVSIPAGSLAFAKTHLRLLVGEEGSPIQIIFSERNKYPLLFGMKALGIATQRRGRVFADFDRLVTRSGKVIPIKAELLDTAGALGTKGERENSKALEIAGGVGLGLLASPEESQSPFGLGEVRQSTSERLRSSFLLETRNYLREQFKETPVLRLEEETSITLMFKEEVRF